MPCDAVQNGDTQMCWDKSPPQFENAVSFSEGLAAVRIDGKWGFIDRRANLVIAPKFLSAGAFKHGRANVKVQQGSKYAEIDVRGRILG